MRCPTCSATLSKPQPGQKPKSSQRPGPHNFTLEGMPQHLTPAPSRTRQTQGIALVIVLLSAMILMVSLLAISATMTISSQRTTVDQGVTLQAQYAAEAGLARVPIRLAEIQNAMTRLEVPDGERYDKLEEHLRNFCGGRFDLVLTPTADGFNLCKEATPSSSSNRYSLFYTYVPSSAYPVGTTSATNYWNDVFAGVNAAPLTSRVASSTGSEAVYSVRQGFVPDHVEVVESRTSGIYRVYFRFASTTVTGELKAGNQVVASRKIVQDSSELRYITVSKPCFCQNVMFRDITTQTKDDGGGQLSFGEGESFDGPVHTNGTPGFIGSDKTGPLFLDQFTTAAAENKVVYDGLSKADHGRMFPNAAPKFGVKKIELPESSVSQLRASFGGDPYDTTPASYNEVFFERWKHFNGYNLSDYKGVYYSEGNFNGRNYSQPNVKDEWLGGIYVQGDVDKLAFSTKNGRQVIEINQGGSKTTFEKKSNGQWQVTPPNKQLNGEFNGLIYVDGDIKDLGGNGNSNPDIAADSELTLTSTGNVIIKDDITYTESPLNPPNGKDLSDIDNVLGIYSSGERCGLRDAPPNCGSIELDGQKNKDLNIDATIMASKKGQGFGTYECGREGCPDKGRYNNQQVRINLTGGIIESQSQTVSSGTKGYRRNYRYDKRFKSGFTPPFFPTQTLWNTSLDDISKPLNQRPQVWKTVSN